MDTTYTLTESGAVKRIRTPHAHDVLSGRGGGINSHEGNKTFRDWVRERKNQYNLAVSKAEKARVAKEVINLVKSLNPPGRFLQRDPTAGAGSMGWWVEIDDTKAMAKTSQALREGAPQIRAAHKDELESKRTKANRRSHSKKTTTTTSWPISPTANVVQTHAETLPEHKMQDYSSSTMTGASYSETPTYAQTVEEVESRNYYISETPQIAVPVVTQEENNNMYSRPSKRVRVGEHNGAVCNTCEQINGEAETPPLAPVPSPLNSVPALENPPSLPKRSNGLRRANSLALSDVISDWAQDDEFVNPFEDESDIENRVGLGYFFGDTNKTSSGEVEWVKTVPKDKVQPELVAPRCAETVPTYWYGFRNGVEKRPLASFASTSR